MSIKLEVGKTYKARNGDIIRIVSFITDKQRAFTGDTGLRIMRSCTRWFTRYINVHRGG